MLITSLKEEEENYPGRVSQVWAQWLHDLASFLSYPKNGSCHCRFLRSAKKLGHVTKMWQFHPLYKLCVIKKQRQLSRCVCVCVCFCLLSQNDMKLFTERCALEFSNCRIFRVSYDHDSYDHNIYDM